VLHDIRRLNAIKLGDGVGCFVFEFRDIAAVLGPRRLQLVRRANSHIPILEISSTHMYIYMYINIHINEYTYICTYIYIHV